MSSIGDRVTALEEEVASRPNTIWTGASQEVTIAQPLSNYASFDVYTNSGKASGVPATNGFWMNFSTFNIGISSTYNGFKRFTRTNNVYITRIDARAA